MIHGIGTDIVEVSRIEESLSRFGEAFAQRILTEREWLVFKQSSTPARYVAKRFAAKEACAKALGTGLRRGVFWRDMGVVNLRSGQPTLALTGGAAARLAEMTPPGQRAVIHLSMTDDHPYAQAFVIIEALPDA